MGTSAGPVDLGKGNVVFHYDMGETFYSYLGEPTDNLIPSPGLNTFPTYANGWATYNTNQYCGNNGCAVYWDIPAIASVSSNIVTTVSAHPIRSFDVINPQTTGGGVTGGVNYLAKKISDTQFSLHEYNSSQDGSQGYINTATGGFKVHDSYWLDQRISVNASGFPTKWWGAPHLPNSGIVKEIIPGGFTVRGNTKTDCVRLHWFRPDGVTDGMAYGADAYVTIGQQVTTSFFVRAASASAVGQYIAFQHYNYGGPAGANGYFLNAFTGALGEWVKCSFTFTPTHNYLISYWFPSTGNMKIDVANIQVEQKSRATQFVAGSRSATQSLKDLTGRATISVANTSFNSNAQMVFDGTDDYINTSLSLGTTTTWEMVIQSSNYNGKIPLSIDSEGYSSGPNIFFTSNIIAWNVGDSGNNAFTNSFYPDSGYHHLVITNDPSSNAKLYIDGTLIGTAAYRDTTTLGSNRLWIGRFHGDNNYTIAANIPVVKIYDTALTAEQVLNNYEQYQKQYNIGSSIGTSEATAAISATAIKTANPGAQDGVYWIKPAGQSAFRAPVMFHAGKAMVCVMKGGGGNGFLPDDALWENTSTQNASDFDLTNNVASKYAGYSTVPLSEFYFKLGATNYPVTFKLATAATSMHAAQNRSWNDSGNRSTPHYGMNQDYRTVAGADAGITATMGTEIYMYGMDLKHEGHYGGGAGSSGGRIRVGSILDESTTNTGGLNYGTAGSAFGLGVNGGNPLKTAVVGYAGWSESVVYASTAQWSLWVVN